MVHHVVVSQSQKIRQCLERGRNVTRTMQTKEQGPFTLLPVRQNDWLILSKLIDHEVALVHYVMMCLII